MPFAWFVALRYLRDAKGQTALILAAVSVGVAVVVFLSALINGLQISLILPVEERVEQYFARIPVQLTVRGTYLSLARFFHSVSQLPRVINMENIRLGTPLEDPVSHEVKLEAQVLATTFRGVTRTAGAAGAAGAAPGAAGAAAPRGGTP